MSIYRGKTRKEFYLASLLYDSIEDRNFSSVKSLLSEKAADPNIVLPKKGISPFHLIIGCESYDFALRVTAVILQHGGDPNVKSDDGLTPVHIAAAWGRLELLKMLLNCGGDPEVRDANYKTPLHYAHEEKFVKCLELLRSYLPIKNDLIIKEAEDCNAYSLMFDKVLINNGHTIGEYGVANEYKTNSIIKKENNLHLLPQTEGNEYIMNWFSKHQDSIDNTTKLPKSTGSATESIDSFESSLDESDDERFKTPVKENVVFRKVYKKTRKTSRNTNDSFKCPSVTYTTNDSKTMQKTDIDAENTTKQKLQQAIYVNTEEFTGMKEFSEESGIVTLPNTLKEVDSVLNDSEQKLLKQNAQDKSSDYLTCSNNSTNSLEKNIFELTDDLSIVNITPDKLNGVENVMEEINNTVGVSNSDLSFVSVSEVYKYVDRDENIILYERRLLKSPSEYAGSVKSSSFSSKLSSLPETIDYDTDTLRKELTLHGYNPGPITFTTKRVYLKKLHQLKKYPAAIQNRNLDPAKKVYSVELEKTLREADWHNDITVYKSLEEILTKQFGNPDPSRKWREGNNKSSFTYLLLDPRVSKNLPCRADFLQPKEIWETFLSAIFYVGKGKRARPYNHLYEAVNVWKQEKPSHCDNKKIRNILDIWKSGYGVICLHVFQNIIPVEAYTREAAMISAIKIENLTNLRAGDYYGTAATWPQKQKKMLGVYLLYKAMMIFINEGERQLCPEDIE